MRDIAMGLWEELVDLFSSGLQFVADQLFFLGDHRWAAAIVVFTIGIKTLLLPLAIKQVRSMRGMQRLQPELKRLQQKHKGDRQKLNTELMELYKREGVNPLGGCLPILAQMPFFIGMFWAIRALNGTVERMPLFGLGDLAVPARESIGGVLLLVMMAASGYLMARQMAASQDPMQARLFKIMPLAFVVIMMNFPAGLVLYWATQNLYQLGQQTIMLRTHPLPVQAEADGKGDGKVPPAKTKPVKAMKGDKEYPKKAKPSQPKQKARQQGRQQPKYSKSRARPNKANKKR